MAAATTEEKVTSITLTLPANLYSKIAAKSASLSVGLDKTMEALLRFGLEAQNKKEAAILELADKIANTEDSAQREELGDNLGELIFGR